MLARLRGELGVRLPRPAIRLSRTPPGDPAEAARYFLPPDYQQRSMPAYDPNPLLPDEYQPGVYRRAARLARRLKAETIIDLGCGRARKLAPLHPRFKIFGLDIGENIRACQTDYPFGTWIEHDLNSEDPLPVSREMVQRSVLICADVIEHLLQPERALHAMRAAFPPARAILISTPDRPRIYSPQLGPPGNAAHVREWSRTEFAMLLRWCGFRTGRVVYTRPSTGTRRLTTSLFIAHR